MPESDDLPLNTPGNTYDPLFAGRIEALGGGSAAPSSPRQPGKKGGTSWGGGFLVLLVYFLVRGCASMTSSEEKRVPDMDWQRPNLSPNPWQDPDDFGDKPIHREEPPKDVEPDDPPQPPQEPAAEDGPKQP